MGSCKPRRRLTARPDATPLWERRRQVRRRTRLRPAKIVSLEGRFITHCRIHDFTNGGARLASDAGSDLPDRFFVFDDCSRELIHAVVVWRRGSDIGVSFEAPDDGVLLCSSRVACLARKFYRVGAGWLPASAR